MPVPRAKQGDADHLNLKRQLRSEMTTAEARLWSRLRARQCQGLKFRRQHGIGPYIVDFYCPEKSLVIEVDGDIHARQHQIVRDGRRETYLKSLGLQVIRYMNEDILKNLIQTSLILLQWRVLSFGSPIRPHSTHPPVGPFRCGRRGRPASATRPT